MAGLCQAGRLYSWRRLPMSKSITRKTTNFLMIGESILNLIALPLGLISVGMSFALLAGTTGIPAEQITEETAEAVEELQQVYNPTDAIVLLFLFFLALSAARFVRGFRLRKEKGEEFFRLSVVQGAAFLAGGLLPVILGYTMSTTLMTSVLCAIALIAGRVFAIVRDHRVRSVIPNIVAIAGIVYCALSLVFMSGLLFLLSVFALLAIVFSRISFSVLKKIVIKTHAAEIFFGLLLLIVTFAMLLTFFEPNMDNFKDALWYCFAIVTTIGFGDLTAVTDFGRILSVILGAYGIVVVALITSIIVNFYGEMKASPETESSDASEIAQSEKT